MLKRGAYFVQSIRVAKKSGDMRLRARRDGGRWTRRCRPTRKERKEIVGGAGKSSGVAAKEKAICETRAGACICTAGTCVGALGRPDASFLFAMVCTAGDS